MKYFTQLDLPELDLKTELDQLLNAGTVEWYKDTQICINGVANDPSNQTIGCGSLYWDWDRSYTDEHGEFVVPVREHVYEEKDFTVINPQFAGTAFEQVYRELCNRYSVGRIRIMRSFLKTCLTWHTDNTTRIHYPIKTQDGCYMVIDDEVMHMPENTWWHTDTTKPHTAFNGSTEDRIHLVVCLLDQ
jgi:hypothetical protein